MFQMSPAAKQRREEDASTDTTFSTIIAPRYAGRLRPRAIVATATEVAFLRATWPARSIRRHYRVSTALPKSENHVRSDISLPTLFERLGTRVIIAVYL